jgi:Tfp pilus assembly protein PilZ
MTEPELHKRREQRYPRINVRLPAFISTIDAEADPETGQPFFRTSEEICANLSHGGAFILTTDAVAPGRRLLVELDIPGGPRVQTIGRVAWTKCEISSPDTAVPLGIGIEFLGGSQEHTAAIERFVKRAGRRSQPSDVPTTGPAPRP